MAVNLVLRILSVLENSKKGHRFSFFFFNGKIVSADKFRILRETIVLGFIKLVLSSV